MKFFFAIVCVILSVGRVHAQSGSRPISNQPTELVQAPPLDFYSGRSGLWPSERVKNENLKNEALSIYDSLNNTAGIQARGVGSPTISIRGSGSSARVLGLYDGVGVNFSDGFGANHLLIPTEALQGLDVIKGPASLFYGADAMGGVVQFQPRVLARPTVRGTLGSFGQRNIFGGAPIWQDRENGNFVQATAFQEGFDNNFVYDMPRVNESGVRNRNDTATQRATMLGMQKTGTWTFNERAIYGEEYGSTPGQVDSKVQLANFQNKAGLVGFTAKNAFSDLWTARYQASHIFMGNHYLTESSQKPYDNQSTRTINSISVSRALPDQAQAEVFVDSIYSEHKDSLSGSALNETLDFESGTIVQFPMDADWIVQPGIRYLPRYSQLIKTVGFFEEKAEQKIWLTYGEGYRPPNLTQLYVQFDGYQPNQSLKPESSTQMEIGFQRKGLRGQSFFQELSYGLSVFSTDYHDLQVSKSIDKSTVTPQNVDSAHTYGIEANLSHSWDILSADVQYCYLETQNLTTGKPLSLSPKNQVQATISHGFGPLIFELHDTYWDKYFVENYPVNQEMGPWNTVDFNVRTLGLTDWSLKTGIFNLFDQPRELTVGFPESQRRFYVSIERYF